MPGGAMVKWLEWSLVKKEDLGSIPAEAKCFSSLLGHKEVGIKWIQTGQMLLHIHVDKKINNS